jgi:hypothetical protein
MNAYYQFFDEVRKSIENDTFLKYKNFILGQYTTNAAV